MKWCARAYIMSAPRMLWPRTYRRMLSSPSSTRQGKIRRRRRWRMSRGGRGKREEGVRTRPGLKTGVFLVKVQPSVLRFDEKNQTRVFS